VFDHRASVQNQRRLGSITKHYKYSSFAPSGQVG